MKRKIPNYTDKIKKVEDLTKEEKIKLKRLQTDIAKGIIKAKGGKKQSDK